MAAINLGGGETSDSATVYPGATTQTASYNNLNQLTNLSGQSLTYDANGNLLSDGQREYAWDAEDRLIEITYPGEPGKQTDFVYDGLDRRTAIIRTPAGGGSTVATSYIWCGTRICQARDGGNTPTRSYFDESEYVPGSPGQTYYYAPDQIGSVRRVFESASIAPAYDYDPWGNLLQVTPPPTDFGFAGMFNEPDSGLYLTQYRAYDPVAGRWLSRDPLGDENIGIVLRIIHPGQTFTASEDLWHIERDDNLYTYVDNNPVNLIDPTGELGRLPSPSTGSSFCPVANKPDIKQFNDAIREIGKAIGRPVTRGERRMIHDAITGQGLGYHDIISEGISLLGK